MVHTCLDFEQEEKLFLIILVGLIDGFQNGSVTITDFYAYSINDLTQVYFYNTSASTPFLRIVERAADIHTFYRNFPDKLSDYLVKLRRDALKELRKHKRKVPSYDKFFSADMLTIKFEDK